MERSRVREGSVREGLERDLAGILDENTWPNWPVLTMKPVAELRRGSWKCGILWSGTGCKVWLVNMFKLKEGGSEQLLEGGIQSKEYSGWEELLSEWEVD